MTKLTALKARDRQHSGRPGMLVDSGNYDMVTRSAFDPATKKPVVFFSGNAIADDPVNKGNGIAPKAGLTKIRGVVSSNNTGTGFHLDARGYDNKEPVNVLTSGKIKVIIHDDVAAGENIGIQLTASQNKIPGNFVKAVSGPDVFNTGIKFKTSVKAGELYDLEFLNGFIQQAEESNPSEESN